MIRRTPAPQPVLTNEGCDTPVLAGDEYTKAVRMLIALPHVSLLRARPSHRWTLSDLIELVADHVLGNSVCASADEPPVGGPRRFVRDLVNGLRYRYPLCCVLAYCWVRDVQHDLPFKRLGASATRGREDSRHVVCGIFHKPEAAR